MRRGSVKIFQVEPISERRGRHGLAVFRPQPLQTPFRNVRRHELRLAAIVKPNQQPFEIRGKVDQLQTLAAFSRLRVTPSGTVPRQSVGIDKN